MMAMELVKQSLSFAILHGLFPCFEDPWAWHKTCPNLFEHPKGCSIRLAAAKSHDRCYAVHATWFVQETSARHTACLGSLFLLEPSLEGFQQALHLQWGAGALQRARALSHVLAEKFHLDGGHWKDFYERDLLISKTHTQHPHSLGSSRVHQVIKTQHVCVLQEAQFVPLDHLDLTILPTAHERLLLAQDIAWARDLLD